MIPKVHGGIAQLPIMVVSACFMCIFVLWVGATSYMSIARRRRRFLSCVTASEAG